MERRSYAGSSRALRSHELVQSLMRDSPVAGGPEKIVILRARHAQLSASLAHYQEREAKQTNQLARLNKARTEGLSLEDVDSADEDLDDFDADVADEESAPADIGEDIRREEEEIRALEEKKRALEERVSGMEKDLGGLLR